MKIFSFSMTFFLSLIIHRIFHSLIDINELNLPRTCTTNFPDPNDLLNFKMIISPDEGYYKGGRFSFNFKVSERHEKDPGSLKC
jgi:ubiquitin-conjugating enzyme E2 M